MLTVITWLWAQPNGRAKYTAHNANVWADMVRRNLSVPHEVAIVTDITEGLDPSIRVIAPPRDFEDVRIPTWGPDKPQCLRRLALFRRDAAEVFGGDTILSMDLDCVIGASIDPLIPGYDVDFKMFKGTSGKRPYNGSLLYIKAGARPQVYDRFTPDEAVQAGERFVGSDQAWISHVLGWGEQTWSVRDGIHAWGSRHNHKSRPRIMFFLGNPKPWDMEPQQNAWVAWNYKVKR